MNPRARILIVDDSVVVRRVLSDIIASDPLLELAGTAATASIGIQKIGQVVPDLVILDVEMPGMDGVEAAGEIRKTWARLPILMCSTLTERGADVTLRALAAGASDYVAKPTSLSGREEGIAVFRAELLAKVRALVGVRVGAPLSIPMPPPSPRMVAPLVRQRNEPVTALVVGSSTGGPNALAKVFEGLPGDLPVPILMVQHMPPLFTRMLADRLKTTSRVFVKEAEHGDAVEPGRAYIAPGGFHMTVERQGTRTFLALNQDPPENSCRPAVDVLFRSAARVYGAGVLGVVLTGMGHDGARGGSAIVEAGGTMFVQDAESCVVPSMPKSVSDAGLAEKILPLDRIALELVQRILRARPRPAFAQGAVT